MGDGLNPETAYDYNGNIKAMTQQGLYNSTSQTIDQLSYTYQPGTNKLAKVADAGVPTTGLGDFKDGTNTDDDYAYDLNGNLTIDKNKNITNIEYNLLNLPQVITVAGKGTITYTYACPPWRNATGNKLSKEVAETGQAPKTTLYLGAMIFENNVLQFVGMEEGRLRPIPPPSGGGQVGAWAFDYFLKDHLGNVRMMLAETGEVLEETSYYPFGLQMKGISYRNPSPAIHNKEKAFQNQQIDENLDLNWIQFKYRNHDPQIGRFIESDPLSHDYRYNSPYAFSENRVTDGRELEGLEYISIHHYADGTKRTDMYYKYTDKEINAMGGTTAGLYNSASYGPLGKGVVHYYYDNKGAVSRTEWDQKQEGGQSNFAYHGLYSGPGSVTFDGGADSENYDFGFQPIDWSDAIAKKHDMDYAAATGKGEKDAGYLEDVRTLQADKDMLSRIDHFTFLGPLGLKGVETPYRTSLSGEMHMSMEGQSVAIGALMTYKQWKIDNKKGNKDTYKTLQNDFRKYDPLTAFLIEWLFKDAIK